VVPGAGIERASGHAVDREPVLFELPPINSAADACKAAAAIVAAAAEGDLTPIEAAELGKLIDAYVKAITATEFEQRLVQLEKAGGQ
jgi:hypothetical protein